MTDHCTYAILPDVAEISPSTAWGSWLSAANPTLRDIHEYILVFSKGSFSRKNPRKRKSTISRDEFAALSVGRHYVGYDVDPEYVRLARRRIDEFITTHLSPRLFGAQESRTTHR